MIGNKDMKIKQEKTRIKDAPYWRSFKNWVSNNKDFIMSVTTIVTALGAIAMAAISSLLFFQSMLSSHTDKRAWVGPSSYDFDPIAGVPLKLSVGYINTGRTPALEVKTSGLLEIVSHKETRNMNELWKEWKANHPTDIANVAVPNIQYSMPFYYSDIKLSSEQIQAINQEILGVYVLGEISYKDIFDHNHLTEFCVHLTPWLGKGTFEPCAEHNTAN